MLEPTLKAAAELGLLADIETCGSIVGYDSDVTRGRAFRPSASTTR